MRPARCTMSSPTPRGTSKVTGTGAGSRPASTGGTETEVSGAELTMAVPHDEQKLTPIGLR